MTLTRTLGISWFVLCATLGAGCASRTEVIIAVETDIPNLDRVSVVVTNPGGMTQTASATFGTGPMGLARTLGVTWSSGPLGPYLVTATGSIAGTEIVSRRAVFAFVQGETRVIHLDLLASCRGITCGAMQTCGETGCRPEMLAPSELEPYTGTIASHDAAGATDSGGPPVDAGSDAGRDAFVPPPDMGMDARVCTTETCNMLDDDCDGMIDEDFMLQTDVNNCGRCGTVCMLPNSTAPTCMMGRCTIGTCDPGFQNCDMRNSTGCESNMNTDVNNCGTCGMRCMGATRMCCMGTCTATCP